ncbi:MAG: ATP-binding cassette domain-containing protein, partial [Oscillospiraceae bacterium]|nr:ATP-binding cassette domain-containing protein [Oscillospiraceae bacterium]
TADAVAKYEQAVKEETEKREQLAKQCEAEKQSKLEKLNAKLAKKNEKLHTIFDRSNQRLQAGGGEAGVIPADTIMRVENVKMYFSGIKAVDDLSFDIKEGEIFGLIGPNGAGKSTLFNCITQFYRATGGKIYYRDKFQNVIDLSHYKSHDVLKTGIARTFQNLEMMMGVSVFDNLLIGTHIYYRASLLDQFLHSKRLKEEEQVNRALALDILERMQLTEYKDMFPGGLPYGVLKRVELARTLMTRPRIIILDEPAAGLNDAETEILAEIIRQVRDDFDCTIFLVEHDMNLVMNVCDTVCAISFGKKLAIGTPEVIQNHPLVQEAYLGEKEEGA